MFGKSKKYLAPIIVGGILVLALLAFGAIKYLESQIVSELRQAIAQAPPDLELQVGSIDYSLLKSQLDIQQISFVSSQDDLRATHKLEQIEIYDMPLELNETTPTTLAEKIIIRNYSMDSANSNAMPTSTFSTKDIEISKLSFDLPNFKHNLLLTEQSLTSQTNITNSANPANITNLTNPTTLANPAEPANPANPANPAEPLSNSPLLPENSAKATEGSTQDSAKNLTPDSANATATPSQNSNPLAKDPQNNLADLAPGLPLELIQKLPPEFIVLAISYALGAEEIKLNNLQMQSQIPQEQLHISIDQVHKQGLNHESVVSSQADGIKLSLDNMPILSIANLSFNDYTAPSYAQLLQIALLSPAKTVHQAAQLVNLLEELFMGSEPLLRHIELNNLTSLMPNIKFSLQRLSLSIPQARSFSYDLQNLTLPPKEFFWLEQSMYGLEALDISSKASLTWAEDLKAQGIVQLAGMAQLDWQGEVHLNTPLVLNSLLGIRALELKQLNLSLEDLGLLGRLAASAQYSWGISPENSILLTKTAIADELNQIFGPEITKQYLPEIAKTLENPGKFELKLNFPQGMPIHMLDKLDLSSFVQFQAIPGPKTLSETMPKPKN